MEIFMVSLIVGIIFLILSLYFWYSYNELNRYWCKTPASVCLGFAIACAVMIGLFILFYISGALGA